MEVSQFQENNFTEKSLQLQPEGESLLRETAKWTKFLAILGFVVLGLIIPILIINLFISSRLGGYGIFSGLLAIGLLALCIYPNYLLYKFSNEIRLALNNRSEITLTEALSKLKSYFKFNGIMAIVAILMYVFIFIAAAIFATKVGSSFMM